MSSFVRKIERQRNNSQVVHPRYNWRGEVVGYRSNPPREKFYMGRGYKLGVVNPKCAALLARRARESRRLA